MTDSKKQTGLKATQSAIKAPSKLEVILSDALKLKCVPLVESFTDSFEKDVISHFYGTAKGAADTLAASSLVAVVKEEKLSYDSYQAIKKLVITAITLSQKQSYETVENWLNRVMRSYLAHADLKGFEMPKATTRGAVAMSASRAKLASIPTPDLKNEIENLMAQRTTAAMTKATSLTRELEARAKKLASARKTSDSKADTASKNDLKKWVGTFGAQDIALAYWCKNNWTDLLSQSKIGN